MLQAPEYKQRWLVSLKDADSATDAVVKPRDVFATVRARLHVCSVAALSVTKKSRASSWLC